MSMPSAAGTAPLGRVLLDALRAHGAREIFGIPGDFALPFFRHVEQAGILPLFTLSHEPAVGFAADAAARWHGGPGVAAVTYGAGALNMVNPVAGAYAEKSPLVVISGAPGLAERDRGLLLHHQARTVDSQFRIFSEITCDQCVLDDPAEAPARLARVLRRCREESRPVYIELPRDQVDRPCAPVPVLPASPIDTEVVDACADAVLARLAEARAPAMIIGVEVRRFGLEDKVATLARRLGLPVASTFMGRGLLAEAEAPLLGIYLGPAGHPEVSQPIEEADALLMLGVLLSDTNFGVSARRIDLRRAIRAVDRTVNLGFAVYPEVPLGALLDALLARLPEATPAGRPVPPRAEPPHGLIADEAPVAPADIARAVNDLFAAHGPMPIAADMGDCLFTAMDIAPSHLVAPGYYATMGFGVPAGLGLCATDAGRPLILVGDGAFQMTGWELGNCQRLGFAPLVIVFNNASWEMLRTFQPEGGYNDLSAFRFADIAETLGGRGHRVSTRAELKSALQAAHADHGRFQLVEVMLPKGAVSDMLGRFVAAARGANS
ncbi:indolepyruvate/phenylpyruvate decarboxylase [Roseospirillum parvum]|uniref:Indolepyruvate decarboxylase n=1 Tax=Roseospirillum parvum TaxID=83401 RepID=A0A1G7YDW0_9PROT|nr:indolepyruvate/phenylpyruvate decarboxylase [Roseospirillum parvum]SDG94505.1 indolepyruvate decarboxylase [Roseospirillum parvum]